MSVNNPNHHFQVLERRKAVSARYLRGESQHAIALALEVGQATVSRDLTAIRDEWRQSAQTDMADRVAQEIAKLDALEREYHKGWGWRRPALLLPGNLPFAAFSRGPRSTNAGVVRLAARRHCAEGNPQRSGSLTGGRDVRP